MITDLQIDENNQKDLGYVLAVSTAVPSLLATFCFYFAGTHYEHQKLMILKQQDEAL
jgi:hypothetical protein